MVPFAPGFYARRYRDPKEANNHLTSLEEELRNIREQLQEFDVGESPTKPVNKIVIIF